MRRQTAIKKIGIMGILIMFSVLMGAQMLSAKVNSLEDGSWSMQFTINKDFTLSSFDGALLSCKKHLSDNSAIRFGLGMSVRDSDINGIVQSLDPNGPINQSFDRRERKSTGFNMSTQYLYYISPKQRMGFYWGIGPQVRYDRAETRRKDKNYNPGDDSWITYSSKNENKTWALGARGSFGLEWFASQNISLLAEYGFVFEKVWRNSSNSNWSSINNNVTMRESDYSEVKFVASSVRLGLTAYF